MTIYLWIHHSTFRRSLRNPLFNKEQVLDSVLGVGT